MKKKVISVFLALALCLTLLPAAAWAEEADTHTQTETGDPVYTVDADTTVQSVENNVAVQTNTTNVAEVTIDGTATQYDDIDKAFTAAQNATGATTVKLLAENVTTEKQILVKSGTFTLDLNGMNWNRSSGYTLNVTGGSVTVTSSAGTGTIGNTGGGTAIHVDANAAVRVTSGVRLDRLYAENGADLTLDVGVIITDTLHVKNGNIAPFLTGKALQAYDADKNTTKNTYASIYNKNYDTGHDSTGCVIVIEHTRCDDTPCKICGYDGTQDKPTEPVDPNVAEIKDTGTKYKTLAAAIAEANGEEITLLRVFGENVVVSDKDSKASIILGIGGTIEGGVTCPSNWIADSNGIPLTMNAGEITLKSGVLAQYQTGANNNIAISLKDGTLTVAGSVTKIIGGSVSEKTDNTVQNAAIEATGGVLDLQGNTHLDGGLSISGDAQLAHKLKAGIFTNSGSTTASVSVEGDTTSYPPVSDSTEYKTVFDLLAEGYAFAKYDTSKENNAGEIVNGYVNKITEDVIVVAHPTHDMTNGACACGYACGHSINQVSQFKNGVCKVCGYVCPHTNVKEQTAVCTDCGATMVVKVEVGEGDSKTTTYYAARRNSYNDDETLWWLFNNVLESDSTVTLLADNLVAWAYVSNGKQITLDLNGKTLEEASQGITVGQGDQEDTTTNNKLIVKGTLGAGEVAEDNNYAFRTWEGGELNLKEVADGGKIGSIIADGGKVTTEDSTSDMKIGTLYINDGSTQLSFCAGTFDKITGNNNKTLGNLLPPEEQGRKSGKAFKYTTGDKAFVPYDTTITSDGVKNVTITDCPHDSIKSGPNSDDITCGTCTYCGMDNIAAVLTTMNGDIEAYTLTDGTADLFGGLTNNGGTLKLYSDLNYSEWLGTQDDTTTKMTIDLNGHTISLPNGATGQTVALNGGKLTITDSGTGKKGSFTAPLSVYYKAGLIVESGVSVGKITAASNFASITLKAGTKFTGYENPKGMVLAEWIEDGCVVSDDSGAVRLVNNDMKSQDGSFTVTKAPATITAATRSGTIRYNGLMPEDFIPEITAEDASVSSVDMQWYYWANTTDDDLAPMTKGGTIDLKDPSKTKRGVVNSDDIILRGFSFANKEMRGVFCVLTAKDSSGNELWSTVLHGYTFTLERAKLSEATVTATDLFYTPGQTQTLEFQVKYIATTLYENSDYQIKGNSNQGENAGKYTLVLEGMGNYEGTREYVWEVKPRVLTGMTGLSKSYDGTTDLPDTIAFTYGENGTVKLEKGTDYTVTGSFDSADAGERTVTATVTLKNKNYTFADGKTEQTFTVNTQITKATAPSDRQSGTLKIANNHAATYTYDVSALLPTLGSGREYGTVTYTCSWNATDSSYTVTSSIDEHGILSLHVTAPNVSDEKQVGSVTVTVTSTNYFDFTMQVNVNAVNKLVPTGEPTLSKTMLTYGEKLSSITLSGAMQDGEATVHGTFAWTQPDAAPAAGSYAAEWKFTPADSSKYMEITGTADVAVNKATPSGAPKYTAITTSGKKLSDAALTTEDGTFSVPGTVAWELPDTTEVTANTAYKWVFTPTDTDNYNEISDSITLYSVSTGGGGGGGSTTTKTETTTNPDGSTTKTETKSDGTVVETTTNKDGSSTKTESKTETKSDGSTVETVTETRTEADGSKTTGKTETTTAKDGTKTETKSETSTAKDGTKTETKSETKTETDGTKTETKSETTTAKDGSKTETKSETKTDANGVTSGTETSTTTAANGSTGTTTTVIENGVSKTEAEAKISDKAVSDAKKSDEAVKIPTEVKAGGDSASAPTVKIDLPKNSGETKIEIPVKDVSAGTVAVIVHPDGTEELIKESLPTEGGVQLTVDGSVTVKIVDNAKDFKDTKNHWAADSIDFVSARGLVNGTGGDSFDPNAASTRAQLWTILARQIGADLTGGASWYEKAQEWAKANGISDGSNPDSSITRAQMVTMLWRAAGSPKAEGTNAFNDVSIGSYYADAIAWAAAHGITTGVGNGAFDPNGTCTRAQIAAFLHRSYLSE